jgi:hypothetical protein
MVDGACSVGLWRMYWEAKVAGEIGAYLKVPVGISGLNVLYILKAVMVLRP